ncbi:hypothetical protein L9F63_003141, partial [Diploptera punctata]
EPTATPEVVEAFRRLEQAIWREEQQAPAPAPALSFANARLQALNAEQMKAEERATNWSKAGGGAGTDEGMRQVILELGIHRNEERAAEHEEFIANINRQILAKYEVVLLDRRREEAEEEVKMLTAKVNYLQGLYQEEDHLLGDLFGEAYGNDEEKKIELELDKLRSYRDTLSGGELQWREAAMLVQNSTELLERAVTCWKQINSGTPESRFHLSTEARNCIQEASLNVQSAQALLSGVQFPYCTTREINAVLQALVYIFTDIQITDRYTHAGQCYSNFHQRAQALCKWIQEITNKSLKKDLADVDKKVSETTERLRKLRVSLIRHKMGDYSMEGMSAGIIREADGLRRLTTAERRFNPQQPLRPAFDPHKIPMQQDFNIQGGNFWPNQEFSDMNLNQGRQWNSNQWGNGAGTQIPGQWGQ